MNNEELQALVDDTQDDGVSLEERARRRATATAVSDLETPPIVVGDEETRLRDTVWIAASVLKMLNEKNYLKSFVKSFAEEQLMIDLVETIGERKCFIS